ncbi:uncharacterized protein LOC142979030 [Anticarsia gemmatalis]|uniref:uncharacterized protein LOC142979030 n=1 Tax=Anticarsia gemmatalis TaxID=129554 RepID=UPI003F762873
MNNYCHVVPWYNSEEWLSVYNEISNTSGNKEHALNTILIWKSRCPSLPSGIESTLSLLQVHIKDIQNVENPADDQLLRLAYSSAIMRFVNHMLDTETVKGTSLYQAAKKLGVPDWIVDLRHDTAHSNNLPCITLLREACSISLQWLQQNYWDRYKPSIKDYVTGQKEVFHGDTIKIAAFINLCTSLSISAHPDCKIKNLSEIPSIDMKESIVNDVRDLFGDCIDLSNLKTVSISSLINIMNKQSKNFLQTTPNTNTLINKIILGEDSMFLSKDLLLFFSAKDFKHRNRLNNNYLQCFEVLLTFLHTNDLLLDFLLALIKITSSENHPSKARLAALWVSEILIALKRSQQFAEKFEKMTTENKVSKKKKDLKQLYHNWFPSKKGHNLTLDLQKPIPEQLLDVNYIQAIIAEYNPYLIYFIKDLLNLLEPSIPSGIAERIYKLAELISRPEKFPLSSTTIYTADDLMEKSEDYDDVEIIDLEVAQTDETNTMNQNEAQKHLVNSIWDLASASHTWSTCPIGQIFSTQNQADETT